jgi:hypothetical protein
LGTAPNGAYALLLRRQTTPLFSASWRRSAVGIPPTPPVLHVAALGGNGPGRLRQPALDVHCTPVMLHVPRLGHSAGSRPGVWQVAPVPLQVPAWLVQPAFVVHGWPAGLLQLPGVGEQPAGVVHALPFGVTHCPMIVGQVTAEVHAVIGGGLLQVPGVWLQFAADVHVVAGG